MSIPKLSEHYIIIPLDEYSMDTRVFNLNTIRRETFMECGDKVMNGDWKYPIERREYFAHCWVKIALINIYI